MGSTKHEKSFVDFEQPYEQNVIGLKGVVYFGVGLLLLIIITFGLMWALLNVLEKDWQSRQPERHPLAQNERDRLPPEPRLQAAPGFGVDRPDGGRVNLELRAPQSELWEMQRQWAEIWEHGQTDPTTHAVTALPIEEAMQKFLDSPIKAKTGPEAEQAAAASKMIYSDASSGRVASIKRR